MTLVLFEFLNRLNKSVKKDLYEDQSEERLLWDLEAILEKHLSEPFKKDNQKLLKKARKQVRDRI